MKKLLLIIACLLLVFNINASETDLDLYSGEYIEDSIPYIEWKTYDESCTIQLHKGRSANKIEKEYVFNPLIARYNILSINTNDDNIIVDSVRLEVIDLNENTLCVNVGVDIEDRIVIDAPNLFIYKQTVKSCNRELFINNVKKRNNVYIQFTEYIGNYVGHKMTFKNLIIYYHNNITTEIGIIDTRPIVRKVVENGQVYLIKNNIKYDVLGTAIE